MNNFENAATWMNN